MNPNPFRITHETLKRIMEEDWSAEHHRMITAYMWGLWADADDVGIDLVGDSCSVTYDEALEVFAARDAGEGILTDGWPTDIHEAMSLCEHFARVFDYLPDHPGVWIDMKGIDPDMNTLPIGMDDV